MYGTKPRWAKKLFPIKNYIRGTVLPYKDYDAAKAVKPTGQIAAKHTALIATEFAKIPSLHNIFYWPKNYESELVPMAKVLKMSVKKCCAQLKQRIKRYIQVTKNNKTYKYCENFSYLNEFLFKGSAVYGYHDVQRRNRRERKIKSTNAITNEGNKTNEMEQDPIVPVGAVCLIQRLGVPAVVVEKIPNYYGNFKVDVRDFI